MVIPDTSLNKGKDDYHIHLNFLSVEMGMSRCVVYRRKCASPQEQRPVPEATAHKLPIASAEEKDWPSYWVLPEAADGFEAFINGSATIDHETARKRRFVAVEK